VALARRGANTDLYLVYADTRNGNPDVYGQRYIPPVAGFIASPQSGNVPLTVVFTDTSTAPNGLTGWEWMFGDGASGSTLQNPTHLYSTPGVFTVTLTAASGPEAGRRTLAAYIQATRVVTAQFTASPQAGFAPMPVTFTNTSQPVSSITAYGWNLGDGYTSTLTNPVHTYTSSGIYTVTLTAFAGAAQDTLIQARFITVMVQAGFDASPVQGIAPLMVSFANTSQPTSSITSYGWDFGDGTPGSTLTDPVHTYTAMGFYTVALMAAAGEVQDSVTRTNYIAVTPGVGQAVAISAQPEDEEMPALAYNPDDQEYLAVWHVTWGGVYARRVTGAGLPLGDSFTVNADGDRFQPAAAYGAGLYLVVFTADGSEVGGQYILPTGVLTGESFLIASGDENDTPAVDYNPTSGEFLVVWHHNYVGNNSVRARRVSAAGTLLGDQIEIAGSINAPSPAHDAAGNYLVVYACNLWPQPAGICGQRLSSDGALIGSAFTILSVATNLAAPDVAYNAQTGEYLVVARQNADGVAEDVYVRRVRSDGTVLGEATLLGAQTGQGDEFGPSAAYHPGANSYLVIWPDNRNGDWDVYGRLVDADGTPMGSPFALEAAAGDQTYVALARQGANTDLYLAFTDTRNGNPDAYGERYIPPIAAFTATPPNGNAPLTVVFTDTSTAPGGITAWEWDLGDGVTSTLQNLSHEYPAIGQYTIALTVAAGLEADRVMQTLTVNIPVSAQFVASPLNGQTPLTVTFTDQTTTTYGTLNSWLWGFGDGYTSTQQNPVHVYPGMGSYEVQLSVGTGTYTDTENKAGYINAIPPTTTVISYAYDGLYRLKRAAYSSGESFEYEYDAVGNQAVHTQTLGLPVVTTYSYDAANRLTTAQASDDPNLWHYAYDNNGNLREVTPNGTTPAAGARRYTYNQANQLTLVETHNGSGYQAQASMTYDGIGQRLSVTVWQSGASVTSRYVVDSARQGAVLAATANSQTTFYLYGLGVIAEQTTSWAYYLKDGQNTVRQMTDDAAVVTLARTYDPFGQVIAQAGSGNLAWGYWGGLLDAATGLVYVGNGQYYDPVTGRFLSPSGRGRNPYLPTSRSDPLGAALGPVALIALVATRRRRKKDKWNGVLLVALFVVMGVGMGAGLTACGPGTETPTPQPGGNTPQPIPDPTHPQPPPQTPGPVPPTPTPQPPSPKPSPSPVACPTPTPSNTEKDTDIVARMLYAEQRSEPKVVQVAAAWVIRNRVDTKYLGRTTYQEQIESSEFAYLTEEQAKNLTGANLQLFQALSKIARAVINGSEDNPMTNVRDAIFFANSSYADPGQQAAYETLLNNKEGCVGPGNWGYFDGVLGRFYYYRNNTKTPYPCSIPFPPPSTPTPMPGK
jgi:RHS repeat-associated protein